MDPRLYTFVKKTFSTDNDEQNYNKENSNTYNNEMPNYYKKEFQNRILRERTQVQNTSRLYCGFCKKNNETMNVYTSHRLKNEKGKIECPILKKYICSICGATGENAHTISYCPFKKSVSAMKNLSITNAHGKFRNF